MSQNQCEVEILNTRIPSNLKTYLCETYLVRSKLHNETCILIRGNNECICIGLNGVITYSDFKYFEKNHNLIKKLDDGNFKMMVE